MTRNQKPSGIAQLDTISNTLLGFIFLFVIVLLLISKSLKEEKKKIDTAGMFLVTVCWDDRVNDDVDTYVIDPAGHFVFFNRQEDGLMHLERDDRGLINDSFLDKSGGRVEIQKNEERVVIRGVIPGEYIVNVHMYRKDANVSKPTTVKVALIKLVGQDTAITEKEVVLAQEGDEKTAFRFQLSADGQVSNINYLQRKIVGPGGLPMPSNAEPNSPNQEDR